MKRLLNGAGAHAGDGWSSRDWLEWGIEVVGFTLEYFDIAPSSSAIGATLELDRTVEAWVPVLDDIVNTPKTEQPKTDGGWRVRDVQCAQYHQRNSPEHMDCIFGQQ